MCFNYMHPIGSHRTSQVRPSSSAVPWQTMPAPNPPTCTVLTLKRDQWVGKGSLRTTILAGPCLYLSPWSKQSSRELKLNHMSTYMEQGSTLLCHDHQTRTLQHVPSDPFTISQEDTEGFGCLPLGDSFGGEKEERNGKAHSLIFHLCTQVLEDFVDFLKSTEARDTIPWTWNGDTCRTDIIKTQWRDPMKTTGNTRVCP